MLAFVLVAIGIVVIGALLLGFVLCSISGSFDEDREQCNGKEN